MGAQGRLEFAPGYIIELAEATTPSLFNPDLSDLELPLAKALQRFKSITNASNT
ncbi:MAG: hypothetical protein GX860_08285 [Alcaligenaceae bacterium]|nr:hypothetical protein [Alcaligenaceae bacterium]